jgi:hypothetical protein
MKFIFFYIGMPQVLFYITSISFNAMHFQRLFHCHAFLQFDLLPDLTIKVIVSVYIMSPMKSLAINESRGSKFFACFIKYLTNFKRFCLVLHKYFALRQPSFYLLMPSLQLQYTWTHFLHIQLHIFLLISGSWVI